MIYLARPTDELDEFAKRLLASQVPLADEFAAVLYGGLWDLYDTDTAEQEHKSCG